MPRSRTRKRRHREIKWVTGSRATLPEYDRGAVPEGLVTRRPLRDLHLSPGDNRGPDGKRVAAATAGSAEIAQQMGTSGIRCA